MYDVIFYLFAFLTVISALVVVSSKNIVTSAFSLLFTFFGVSGLYALLGADFVAITQLLVYVGGILILILFGVMLTNNSINVYLKSENKNSIIPIIIIAVLSGGLLSLIIKTEWFSSEKNFPETTIYSLGNMLINQYILIFELLAILLLIALVGAASVARKESAE